MGRGWEFIDRQAREDTKKLLNKFQTQTSRNTPPDFQIGQMNDDRTSVTLPDGSVVPALSSGIPGDYAFVGQLNSGQMLAKSPAPQTCHVSSSQKPYVLNCNNDTFLSNASSFSLFDIKAGSSYSIDISDLQTFVNNNQNFISSPTPDPPNPAEEFYLTNAQFSTTGSDIVIIAYALNSQANIPYNVALPTFTSEVFYYTDVFYKIISNWSLNSANNTVNIKNPILGHTTLDPTTIPNQPNSFTGSGSIVTSISCDLVSPVGTSEGESTQTSSSVGINTTKFWNNKFGTNTKLQFRCYRNSDNELIIGFINNLISSSYANGSVSVNSTSTTIQNLSGTIETTVCTSDCPFTITSYTLRELIFIDLLNPFIFNVDGSTTVNCSCTITTNSGSTTFSCHTCNSQDLCNNCVGSGITGCSKSTSITGDFGGGSSSLYFQVQEFNTNTTQLNIHDAVLDQQTNNIASLISGSIFNLNSYFLGSNLEYVIAEKYNNAQEIYYYPDVSNSDQFTDIQNPDLQFYPVPPFPPIQPGIDGQNVQLSPIFCDTKNTGFITSDLFKLFNNNLDSQGNYLVNQGPFEVFNKKQGKMFVLFELLNGEILQNILAYYSVTQPELGQTVNSTVQLLNWYSLGVASIVDSIGIIYDVVIK